MHTPPKGERVHMDNDKPQLVIRDIPFGLWFFGLVFSGFGVLMAYSGGPPLFMSLLFLGVGLAIGLFASVVTITADRITRSLTMESRSALRSKRMEVLWDDIIGINVERTVSSGRGARYLYGLTLLRKDGQVVALQQYKSSGREGKESRAIRLREFIGIRDTNRVPSGMIPMELSQFSEVHETDSIHWQIQPLTTYGATAPTGFRWSSTDFKTTGCFLFLAQKGEGQSSTGFLASLGKMLLRQAFSAHGFQPEEAPSLEDAITLEPLDPSIESHFLAYTNEPDRARSLLNATTTAKLSQWAGKYPLKQLQSGGSYCQLMVLFGPSGVAIATNHLLERNQAYELISYGVELVKSQKSGFGCSASNF